MPDASLGATIRALRHRAGLSGRALAERIGRSQAWVSRVECDRSTPTADDVERLAKVLDCTAEQTAELVRLAREPRPVLSAVERRALVRRIEALLDVIAQEVHRLR
jgi:transcriptional regulator with XRE-family HTH domain